MSEVRQGSLSAVGLTVAAIFFGILDLFDLSMARPLLTQKELHKQKPFKNTSTLQKSPLSKLSAHRKF